MDQHRPVIPFQLVNEARAESGGQAVFARQRRLERWLDGELRAVPAWLADATTTLVIQVFDVFEHVGGHIDRIDRRAIERSAARVQAHIGDVLPVDEEVVPRITEHVDTQPVLLATLAMWVARGEAHDTHLTRRLDDRQRAMVFALLWVVVDAVHHAWTADNQALVSCAFGLMQDKAQRDDSYLSDLAALAEAAEAGDDAEAITARFQDLLGRLSE